MSRKTIGGGTLDEERDARLKLILEAAHRTVLGPHLPNTGLLRTDGGTAHEVTLPSTIFIAMCNCVAAPDDSALDLELVKAIEFELAQQLRVPSEL